MRRILLPLWTYFEYFILLVFFLPIFAISRFRHRNDPMLRQPGRWMRIFGRMSIRLTPLWDMQWEGTPPADIHERGYVVVSNHESMADIFLLTWLPWDMRWVAKEELFRTPFVGWALRMSGDIPIKRGNRDSVESMLAECTKSLRHGMPIMIFPEGTRTRDGRLRPFKDGAFHMAIDCGVPVLPVAIAGTRECVKPNSLLLGECTARARVLEPISTEGMTIEDLPRLREMAREHIQVGADELKVSLGIPQLTAPKEETFPITAQLGTTSDR